MLNKFICVTYLSVILIQPSVIAQTSLSGLEHLFTEPLHYTSYYTAKVPLIDGDIDDAVWRNAEWTGFFKDIEGDKRASPALNTRVKMLWNDNYLFIAAELEEPHVWGKLQKHDEIVFQDNDFEIFIDPDNNTHQYFEIEVNALNTIFDLFLSKPYRNSSGALISWDAPGLKSGVKIQGSLNDPNDKDKGWTVEMAIPFRAVSIGDDIKVPAEGDVWRINFSRVEWDCEVKNGQYIKKKDSKGKVLPEHNWVWSPQGVVNMHYPERWGYLQFSRKSDSQFILPFSEKQRRYLWLVYYRQKEYFSKYRKYALSLPDIGIDNEISIDGRVNVLTMLASGRQFCVSISAEGSSVQELNEEGLIQITRTE